ncbi:MAG: cupin domain-containing protein [Planctomycetota bacterium]
MSTHTCPLSPHLSAYALGPMPDEVREALEEHLLEGCAACADELAGLREAIARVDLAKAEEEPLERPPETARARLMRAIAAEPRPVVLDALPRVEHGEPSGVPGVTIVPGAEAGWDPQGTPGVSVRQLFSDPERRSTTTLVRMEPGARFAAHYHAGVEECFVLQGDVRFGERRMTAGDYQVAEPGSVHPEHVTDGGCTLLVVAVE